ncbi:MAG: hypothetical protein K2J08_11140 [Ruminococcus sp.]|nr:hypothetical protein [Ruminococcus sp.]
MKNAKEKIFSCIKILFLIFTAVLCLVRTEMINTAVSGAVERCLTVIIPSLYAMMIVAPLLIKSGVIGCISGFFGNIGKILFGMENTVFSIFLFSMLAGYPTGAKMLLTAHENGLVSKKRAEIFCGLCYGAGSAFVFGCISGRLFSITSVGKIIIISNITANILLAFVISFFTRKECSSQKYTSGIKITSDMLTECVTGGGRSIAEICFMVTAFAVFTEILSFSGIIPHIATAISAITELPPSDSAQILCAFLDVTAVNGFSYGNFALLPYLSALVSFGGVCVIFQISAVISGKLSVKPLVIIRLSSALLSFLICKIITPLMLSDEVISTASVNVRTHQANSPVPSLMLIIMTLMLFSEFGKISREV